jgi:hypothetical protein
VWVQQFVTLEGQVQLRAAGTGRTCSA